MNKKNILDINKSTWNSKASNFIGTESLPYWYPFDNGKLNLINKKDIRGKTFLELACGSGHSLNYLLKNGAKMVYGIDFSDKQIKFTEELNKNYINKNKLKLFCKPMESNFNLKEIDIVFSIYGMGWSQDPEKVLKNVFKVLKKRGKFIWSFDHPLCAISKIEGKKLKIINKYHNSKIIEGNLYGSKVYQLVGSISWWFDLIKKSGFKVIKFIETNPKILSDYNDYGSYYAKNKLEKIPSSMIWILEK